MTKKYGKRLFCALLSTVLVLTTSGCGEKEMIVEDYGTVQGDSDTAEAEDTTSTATDSIVISKGDDKTLHDIFGANITFNEDFTIDNRDFSGSGYAQIPTQDHLNAYNMQKIGDGKADEEKIVKNFFGDTAEKVNNIQYKNAYDYIPLMYKYRYICAMHEAAKKAKEVGLVYLYTDPFDGTVIDSSDTTIYNWKDDEDLYIHMYEGDYEGKRFVMLLAYDYLTDYRYIYIEPKSIKEYFPDGDYQTSIVSGTLDHEGNEVVPDNQCEEKIEDIEKRASDLLSDKLLLGEKVSVTRDPWDYISISSDTGLLFYTSPVDIYSNLNGSPFDPGPSALIFSNVDYLSTLKTGDFKGLTIDYKLLASQRSLWREHLSSHVGSELQDYDLLSSSVINDMVDNATLTADGYAVYIDIKKPEEAKDDTAFDANANNGMIKYTSKGFYGLDLCIAVEIVDVIENVNLLEFDKIKESLKAGLEEQVDFSKMNDSKEYSLNNMSLMYYSYSESEDFDKFMNIPVWSFNYSAKAEGAVGMTVYVNAMDGSIVDIVYYDYTDLFSGTE
ncbi:MAG: hypothetical protein ILA13_08715 [Eubacterium sp.]|nr:hypothetical protein [Eubacterium sp.]